LVLCEFWTRYLPRKYVANLKGLLEERKWKGKVTILTTCNDIKGLRTRPEEIYDYLRGDMRDQKIGIVVEKEDRKILRQKTNDYFLLYLPQYVIDQLALTVNGSSGDIIKQLRCIGRFFAENPAVPLVPSVLMYALKEETIKYKRI